MGHRFVCTQSSHSKCNKYPSAEPEVLSSLAHQRGLFATEKKKCEARNTETKPRHCRAGGNPDMHSMLWMPACAGMTNSGTVKLWESPGRAGSLPVQWIGQAHITPYVMYEYNRYHPTLEMYNGQVFMFGVNIKPVPFVALKLEGDLIHNSADFYSNKLSKNIVAQLAVFF